MAFDFPEALELTPSANLTWQAVTGPMVSQLTVNKTESAASVTLDFHRRECTRRPRKGSKALGPAFARAATSVCDVGQLA